MQTDPTSRSRFKWFLEEISITIGIWQKFTLFPNMYLISGHKTTCQALHPYSSHLFNPDHYYQLPILPTFFYVLLKNNLHSSEEKKLSSFTYLSANLKFLHWLSCFRPKSQAACKLQTSRRFSVCDNWPFRIKTGRAQFLTRERDISILLWYLKKCQTLKALRKFRYSYSKRDYVSSYTFDIQVIYKKPNLCNSTIAVLTHIMQQRLLQRLFFWFPIDHFFPHGFPASPVLLFLSSARPLGPDLYSVSSFEWIISRIIAKCAWF